MTPMRILVANLGSTSFKYKLLDMDAGGEAGPRGSYERIGQTGSPIPTHADVIDAILKALPEPPDAIGFKAVHGGPICGAVRVDRPVIATMEQFADVGPGTQSALRRGDEGFRSQTARKCRRWRRLRPRFTRPFRSAGRSMPSPMSGPKNSASAGMAFTAPAIAISPRACRNCSARKRRRIISCHLGGSLLGLRHRKRQVGRPTALA